MYGSKEYKKYTIGNNKLKKILTFKLSPKDVAEGVMVQIIDMRESPVGGGEIFFKFEKRRQKEVRFSKEINIRTTQVGETMLLTIKSWF